jgi:hypothetical protein
MPDLPCPAESELAILRVLWDHEPCPPRGCRSGSWTTWSSGPSEARPPSSRCMPSPATRPRPRRSPSSAACLQSLRGSREPPVHQTNNAYRWAGETDVLEALADVMRRYPVDERRFVVRGLRPLWNFDQKSNSSDHHGVAMIYPNPRNPHRYVVINSGHTFHDAEIGASSASLYPRLGDVAIIRFQPDGADFAEETVWADIFDGQWQFSSK